MAEIRESTMCKDNITSVLQRLSCNCCYDGQKRKENYNDVLKFYDRQRSHGDLVAQSDTKLVPLLSTPCGTSLYAVAIRGENQSKSDT